MIPYTQQKLRKTYPFLAMKYLLKKKKLPTTFEHFINIMLIFTVINNDFEYALNLTTSSIEFEFDMI